MPSYRFDRESVSDGGFDWPRALVLILGLLLLAPAILLGGLGVVVWRTCRWSRPAALLVLALSPIPAAAERQLWSANPVELYLDAQGAAIFAAIGALTGQDFRVSAGLTLGSYLVAIAPATLPAAVLVGLALAWFTRPKRPLLQVRDADPLVILPRVERRAKGGVNHPVEGWALGYDANGGVVSIADSEARHHVIVCGSTGAGKTTVIRHVLDGVTPRGPVVLLDCKASPMLRRVVEAIPGSLTWTIGGPLRWDALRGDPTCFASKLLAAEQFGPNAAIYRAAAERYVQWVGRVLEWSDLPRDPDRVAELLGPKMLALRLRELRTRTSADWWAEHGEPLAHRLADLGKAEEEGIAGFAARFGVVVEGIAAGSLGVGPDPLVLDEAISEGRTVLFSLDAATYPTLAAKIGAWVLLDLVRIASRLQADDWAGDHQLYVVVDEFSALREEGRHVVSLLARAREAGVACVLATQGLADLERVDRTLPQQIVQNTAVRILLRQQSYPDALAWARHLGELEREELSRRIEPAGFGGGERDVGIWSTRWRRDFRVRPEELQALATGETIVHVAPVIARRPRIERVRIAQPRGPGAAPTVVDEGQTVLDLVFLKVRRRR